MHVVLLPSNEACRIILNKYVYVCVCIYIYTCEFKFVSSHCGSNNFLNILLPLPCVLHDSPN